MNERIERMLKQATVVTEGWSDENGTTRYYSVDQEKFAELIIQEHVDLLRREWYTLNAQESSEEETSRELGIRVGKKIEIISLIHKIKEHFGVEG